MNYANELFGPGCLQKPLGRTQNTKDTEASAFQAPPVHWEDNTVSSLLICFTVETHTQAYIHIDSFFLSFADVALTSVTFVDSESFLYIDLHSKHILFYYF